jgi:hypothetical protein
VPDDRIKLIAGSSVWKTALSSKDKDSADNDFAAYLASSDSESSSSSDSGNESDTNDTNNDTAAAAVATAAAAVTDKAVVSTAKAKKPKKASLTKEQKAAHARKVLLAEIGMLNSSDEDDNADNDNEVLCKCLFLYIQV